MVKTIIGGVNVQEYITEYSCDFLPEFSNNDFKTVNGKHINKKMGDNVVLNIRLEEVPTNISLALASALEADEVYVDYTTPLPRRQKFYKTSYRAECDDADPDNTDFTETDGILWNISLTLHSVDIAADGGDGL